METKRDRLFQVSTWTTSVLFAVALSGLAVAAWAQTGRYETTTQAQQAFARGQAQAADGDRYLTEGEPDRARRAYQEAEESYREALQYDSDYLDAIERLSYVLYVSGRSDEAVELLEEALISHPDNLPLRRMLGINLYELDRFDQAIPILEEIDQMGGTTADVTFILAKHYYEREDYQAAIPYFQRYLVDHPSDAATHGALGNAYLRTDQYELALAEFRTVLDLDENNLAARINIGDVYFASGDFERAINVYTYVVERDPENVRLWFNLGKSYFEEGRYPEALEAFEQVTRLRPDLHQGHYYEGATLVELDRYEEGRQALARAIALEPTHALSYYRLGLAEAHLGRLQEADEALTRATGLNPEEPWFLWAQGDVRRRMGRFEEAIDLHQGAIRLDAGQTSFHESLGRDLYALDRTDEAMASLEQALEIDPSSSTARPALAVVLLRRVQTAIQQERLNTARVDLNRVTELGTHPLHTALASAVLALMEGDQTSAQTVLDSVTGPEREELSFRRVLAQLLLVQGQPGRIGEVLADLVDLSPDQLDGRDAALLGHGAAQAEDWERAQELFTRAAQSDDRFQAAVALCQLRRGLEAADRGRWGDAEELLRQAADLGTQLDRQDQIRIQYALGIAALASGNWGRAQRALGEVRREWGSLRGDNRSRLPSRDVTRNLDLWLAYAYYRDRNYREAIDQLRAMPGGDNAQLVEELLVSSHDHLARAELEQDNPRAAREHFEAVLERVQNNPITRNNFACLLYSSAEQEEAGRIFQALAEEGSVVNAIFNYAIYLDEVAGEPEEAYRYYLRYVERGGEAADRAQQFARVKEEVFGFERE